jgi:hypothetical protein
LRLEQSAVGLTNLLVKYDILTWKGWNHKEREVKQQVPKEVRSYSIRRIYLRISDRYSSTSMLHNLLRQDSFQSMCGGPLGGGLERPNASGSLWHPHIRVLFFLSCRLASAKHHLRFCDWDWGSLTQDKDGLDLRHSDDKACRRT